MKGICRIGFLLVLALLATAASAAELAVLRNGFSIRHQRREVIESTTRLYLPGEDSGWLDVPSSAIERFEPDDTPAAPVAPPAPALAVDLNSVIGAASDKHLIDADLIHSMIRAESGFNQLAVSRKGAQGLMQLMPDTASKLGVSDAFDPAANVDGGTRYIRELLLRYNGNVAKALAAYNAGPHRVEQYKGVPPYRETQKYVRNIIRDFNRKKLAEKKARQAAPRKAAKAKPGKQG